MKTSQLRQIIKEEISKALSENYEDAMSNLNKQVVTPTTASNTMKPKLIHIEFTTRDKIYKTFVDGVQKDKNEVEKLIKNLTGLKSLSFFSLINDPEKEEIRDALKKKDVKFTWNNTMDVS